MAKFTAIIDFGSNSVRLAIFQRTSRFGFKVIHESKSRVRIGEGAYQKGGVLQQEPMDRAILSLKWFNSIIKSFNVRKTLAIATSALRDAPNKAVFISRAKKELDINIKIINGETEAFLGGIACANLLDLNESAISIDIGGGSTEFSLITENKVLSTFSINLGTVRLKELFENDITFDNAILYIHKELIKLPSDLKASLLIGIGGTIRALSKVIQKHIKYPLPRVHNYKYKYENQKVFIDSILKMSKDELELIGFKKDRVDVIRWGVLIFKEIIEFFHSDEIITSGVGIREGLFLKDILRSSNNRFPDNFNPSIRNILDDIQGNKRVEKSYLKINSNIFDILKENLEIPIKYLYITEYVVKLMNIGKKIDVYGNSKNGYHLILNSLIYKISHEDSILIAILVRYSSKKEISEKIFHQNKELLPDYAILQKIHAVIYISKILSINNSYSMEFSTDFKENTLFIKFSDESLFYAVNEKLELLELFKVNIAIG